MSTQIIRTVSPGLPKPVWLAMSVVGFGLLLVIALSFSTGLRFSETNNSVPNATTLQLRELRFEDKANGDVAVLDAGTHALVDTITGEAGFVRSTLRGLARERKLRGYGADAPFELAAFSDGRLTLRDPMTKRHIELEAFGAQNAAQFARMLQKTGKGDRP